MEGVYYEAHHHPEPDFPIIFRFDTVCGEGKAGYLHWHEAVSYTHLNKEIFKLAEEATNVHIEWMPIAAADATDKVNIMLTSDLPDAFLGLIGTDQIASSMDSFADLAKDDLLKTYAPHIVEDYELSLIHI